MPVFTIGAVFSRFFKLLTENAVLFIGLALLCNVLPTLALTYSLMSYLHVTGWNERFTGMTEDNVWYILGGSLLVYLINLAVISIVTEIAIVRAVGKKVSFGATLTHALGNILPMFVIGLLVGLIVGGGAVLLLVPGIIWALCTWVSIPAYIGQPGLGIWGAIMKSFALTRNHRWQLF